MASLVKQKIRDSVKDTSPKQPVSEIRDKYLLSVSAGPSYDESTHKPVLVNDPNETCTFSNEFLTAQVKVRIRDYHGLPKGSPSTSAYFEDKSRAKDMYSVAFSFVPKQDLSTTDVVWGNDFDHPVRDRLPPGFNAAFKIVKVSIDPGLSCDAYADKPWIYGPALACWFRFRIGDIQRDSDGGDFPCAKDTEPLQEGADGTGTEIRNTIGIPSDSEKRRKFFLDTKNREKLVFEKGRCYQGDFFNPYLDFSKFALRLPGFSLGVLRYIDDKSHTLRYTFKNRQTGDVYFVVVFKLLYGAELENALEEDGDPKTHRHAPAESSENNGTIHKDISDAESLEESNIEFHDAQDIQPIATQESEEPLSIRQRAGHAENHEIRDALDDTSTSNSTAQRTNVLDIYSTSNL